MVTLTLEPAEAAVWLQGLGPGLGQPRAQPLEPTSESPASAQLSTTTVC